MNNLAACEPLHNHYFVMRHGESKANIAGIIIASPENGLKGDYGLTKRGFLQAEYAAAQSSLGATTIIYSSDFSRAQQTAETVAHVIGAALPQTVAALRERYFGAFETQSNTHYQDVWVDDSVDAAHQNNGVEAVDHVVERSTAFILELEKKFRDETILLVSHGDTLQILQTAFEKIDCRQHRSLSHLETAEIRELRLK
jgi:broad specificity phosphatase PhoE